MKLPLHIEALLRTLSMLVLSWGLIAGISVALKHGEAYYVIATMSAMLGLVGYLLCMNAHLRAVQRQRDEAMALAKEVGEKYRDVVTTFTGTVEHLRQANAGLAALLKANNALEAKCNAMEAELIRRNAAP